MSDAIEVLTMEQGSDAWFAARLGIPTASEFASIVADWDAANAEHERWQRNRSIVGAVNSGMPRKDVAEAHGLTPQTVGAIVKKGVPDEFSRPRAKLSATYMRKLAGERIAGQPAAGVETATMRRGKVMEAEARDLYEFVNGVTVERVGLIKNHGAGYSPDGLIGEPGLIEIKTMEPHILIEHWEAGCLPSEHTPQCQGGLWVSTREWLDFWGYWPGMEPLAFRVERDDAWIVGTLCPAVCAFLDELEDLVARYPAGDSSAIARAE